MVNKDSHKSYVIASVAIIISILQSYKVRQDVK